MQEHVLIEAITPCVDGGRYAVKRVVGRPCVVEADVFRDGHELVRAVVRWKRASERTWKEAPMRPLVNDRWRGELQLEANARYEFVVQAWTDGYGSWLADLKKRVDGAQPDVRSEVSEGLQRLQALKEHATSSQAKSIDAAVAKLRSKAEDPPGALEAASRPALLELVATIDPRLDAVTSDPPLPVWADRPRAELGAWYELFIRSQGTVAGEGATFADAEQRLRDIRAMGFDVVYLAPIHPIGTTKRKGRNNTLVAGPDDPGSPWAIGSPAGGHDAVEPALGTLDDFDRFVAATRRHGMEVALDLALQCSPDHPWVKQHPEWFFHRPDGTIKYAENPPKKYQDIYPLDFDSKDRKALWEEIRRIVLFWVSHGVKIFRVDNPHTKPVRFWEWLIGAVQSEHPDVLFLAEAFTRPKMMRALAKAGFTQSYTYFTWRNTKWELTEYLTELTTSGMQDYFRPNFFANTPDILHEVLQRGGPPAFRLRLVLAATLAPSYGIYSGYELCENEALPGREEYADSEKYEIKVRDWDAPGHIKELVARLNAIRRDNPALHELANLTFLPSDSEDILFYAKATADLSNVLLVAVNLDPFQWHECTVTVPLEELGLVPGQPYQVTDLLTGSTWTWGESNYVRLDPDVAPAHVLRIERTP